MEPKFNPDGTVNRYAVNDLLTDLASAFGKSLDDETLNDLTHHVADVLDGDESTDPAEIYTGPTYPEYGD